MGGGVAFFDYDNDGNQDLLFINSTEWPWHTSEGKPRPTMALYHNDGSGHFTDVTKGSGLDVRFYGMGVAVGDYDNDGLPDVFITAVGGNHLFHNEGGGPALPGWIMTTMGNWIFSCVTTSNGRAKSTPKSVTRSTAALAPTVSP